ncbi:MAG: hypothetical protein WCX31_02135 [Salinivirgaceae bacterium]
MKNNLHLLFLICLMLSTKIVHPQSDVVSSPASISTYNTFREPSRILIDGGFGNLEPLIFEADLVPYFMLSLNRNVRWGIELSPRIIMRMYNKKSYPVLTPSFMPRMTVFYHLIDHENEKRDLFTYFSLFHHSNGQEGEFYNTDSITVNNQSGSFSTNWFEGGIFLSRPDPNFQHNINYFKLYAAYDFQQDNNLDGIYGRLRFFGNLQSNLNLSKIFSVFRQTDISRSYSLNQSVRLGWIAGELIDTKGFDRKRFIFQYTINFKPAFLNNITFFAQYYYGQDYYNIYFNRTLNVLRFGISTRSNIFN